MKIDILTLFPKMFEGPFNESIVRRAQDKSLVEVRVHNLRDWATDKRGTVDDRPFGGGVGMVMRVDVIYNAIKNLKKTKTVLLSPRGKVFNQQKARELSKMENLILICGHYEGVDERVSEHLIDEEISIGDYILTGGEIPAMIVTDAVVRLLPGVLEKESATVDESFTGPILEYPQYTRPEDFMGWKVPEILLSGNHAAIKKWRREKASEKTKKIRPDLQSSD